MSPAIITILGLLVLSSTVIYCGYLVLSEDDKLTIVSIPTIPTSKIIATYNKEDSLSFEHENKEITSNELLDISDTPSATIDGPNNEIRSEIYFIDYNDSTGWTKSKEQIQVILNNYFSGLIAQVREAKKKIYVLDYFEHGTDIGEGELFYHVLSEVNKNYFSEIEKIVKNNQDIEYTRILQIPLFEARSLKNEMTSTYDYAKYALKLVDIYSPFWGHILNISKLNNFKLYVLPVPLRTPSEMIIDERVWFFESDRYNKSYRYGKGARAKPDLLFLHRAEESESTKSAILYEQDLINAIISKRDPLTKKQLASIINEMPKRGDKPKNSVRSHF